MTIIVANTASLLAETMTEATAPPTVSSTAAGAKWGTEIVPL